MLNDCDKEIMKELQLHDLSEYEQSKCIEWHKKVIIISFLSTLLKKEIKNCDLINP